MLFRSSAINEKVTSIKITHAHLIRAFFFFIILLLIDPVTYQLQSIGIISKAKESCTELCVSSSDGDSSPAKERIREASRAKVRPQAPETPRAKAEYCDEQDREIKR